MGTALRYGPEKAEREEVIWKPLSEPQRQFLHSTEYEVLYGGAKGGAKSESLLIDPLRWTPNPKWRALILRETYPELRELQDRAANYYPKVGGEWEAGNMRYVFPSGSFIEFGYCSSIDDVQRYQGREWGGIYYDELGNLAHEAVWTKLSAEVRSPDPTLPRRLRGSANPGGAGHAWLKRRFIQPCGKQGQRIWSDPATGLTRRFIPAKVTDNPIYANDPLYLAQLEALPEQLRRQLRDGDWDAGEGLALPDLDAGVHIVRPFDVPEYWEQFGAFDWGYNHPYVFGYFVVSADGVVYLKDSVWGRKELPSAIRDRVESTINLSALRYIEAGHDLWHDVKARGEQGPTIAERFEVAGWKLRKATISRVSGLNNLRLYLTHEQHPPRFRIMDTPGNRKVFSCLESMVVDPEYVEDALKVDADDSGQGGDDAYDMCRYGLMSRPITAKAPRPDLREVPEGVSPGYDYQARKPRVRFTAEEEVALIFERAQPVSPVANRHQIPRR